MAEEPGEQNKSRNYDWLKPTQFKPGQSGNPDGLAKGHRKLSLILKEILAQEPAEANAQVRALLKNARDGKGDAAKILWDRHDGAVTQKVQTQVESPELMVSILEWQRDHFRVCQTPEEMWAFYLEAYDAVIGMGGE